MRWGKLIAAAMVPLLLTTTHREGPPATIPAGGARLIGRETAVSRPVAVVEWVPEEEGMPTGQAPC